MCDNWLSEGWYRFEGAAGTKMPTTSVDDYHCNTVFSGWLNGAEPTVRDGEVFRTVCFTRAYQTLSPVRRTFVFLGSRCTQPLTPRNAHAIRYEFSKWRTGQRGK